MCLAGLLLTAEAALCDAKLGELLRKAGVPAWSALATLLVEIRHDGSSSTSRWAPYVAVLPNTCGSVLEWPRNEVRRLLACLFRDADLACLFPFHCLVHCDTISNAPGILGLSAYMHACMEGPGAKTLYGLFHQEVNGSNG